MTKKLRINRQVFIRQEGYLYCLTDLYAMMNMRNERSSPQNWAESREGIFLSKRGFFRKTYWGSATQLADYAESLNPGIAKEVRSALGDQLPPYFLGYTAKSKGCGMVYSFLTDDWQPSPVRSRSELVRRGDSSSYKRGNGCD